MKKFLTIALSLLVTLGLAACQKSNDQQGSTNNIQPPATNTQKNGANNKPGILEQTKQKANKAFDKIQSKFNGNDTATQNQGATTSTTPNGTTSATTPQQNTTMPSNQTQQMYPSPTNQQQSPTSTVPSSTTNTGTGTTPTLTVPSSTTPTNPSTNTMDNTMQQQGTSTGVTQ